MCIKRLFISHILHTEGVLFWGVCTVKITDAKFTFMYFTIIGLYASLSFRPCIFHSSSRFIYFPDEDRGPLSILWRTMASNRLTTMCALFGTVALTDSKTAPRPLQIKPVNTKSNIFYNLSPHCGKMQRHDVITVMLSNTQAWPRQIQFRAEPLIPLI